MRSAVAVNAIATTAVQERSMAHAEPRIRLASGREETLLKLDLSDLVLPKVNDLQVDELKSSWLSRLFGRH